MITIKNVALSDGTVRNVDLDSCAQRHIDGSGLTLLPALIDPHVHFRVPGAEHKETWVSGAQAALAGGVTTVFDMPNNTPSCVTAERLRQKAQLIKEQLQRAAIPLRSYLYIGADRNHLDEIVKVKNEIIGIKMFMGSSTGDLLIDDEHTQEQVFQIAATYNLVLSVHAEEEAIIRQNQQRIKPSLDPAIHSIIRDRQAAITAVERAIRLAEKHRTKLVILHCSTKEELELLRRAKRRGVRVYVEACPRHLFLDESAYQTHGNLAKVNPPLRSATDRLALWEAIHDNTVDFIGSDHSPHTLEEKQRPYDQAPAGAPGVQMTLPLLLDACNHGWLSLKKVIELTRTNIEKIFKLSPNDDVVLVDHKLRRTVEVADLRSKAGWSLFSEMTLTGWPVATIIRGNIIEVGADACQRATL